MSDASQGPGWWQASDGKWYPPDETSGGGSSGGRAGGVDIGTALGYGWNKFVQNIGPIIVIFLVIIGVQILFQVISYPIDSLFLKLILLGVGVFISFMLSVGLVRAALAITEGRTPEPSMLFSTDNLGSYIVASILFGLLYWVGSFICLGALLVFFFLFFYGFFVVDRGTSPTEALSGSFNLVKDNAGSIAAFMIVAWLLTACTCGLAWPVVYIAAAYVYKTLNGEPVAA